MLTCTAVCQADRWSIDDLQERKSAQDQRPSAGSCTNLPLRGVLSGAETSINPDPSAPIHSTKKVGGYVRKKTTNKISWSFNYY